MMLASGEEEQLTRQELAKNLPELVKNSAKNQLKKSLTKKLTEFAKNSKEPVKTGQKLAKTRQIAEKKSSFRQKK